MRPRRLVRSIGLLVTIGTGVLLMAPIAAAPEAAASSAATAQSGPGGVAPLTAAQAAALSTNVTDRVIVVLKNQISGIPDTAANVSRRADAVASAQAPFLAELKLTHATGITPYSIINGFTATMSPGEAQRLADNPDVSSVVKDEPIPVSNSMPTIPKSASPADAENAGTLSSACASGGQVQLNPQAILAIHAASNPGGPPSAQSLGYTGAGVKVAFIADGLDIDNPDFIRADGQPVFVDYQDFSGTGTSAPTDGGEAFLDSSSIAAQGREVYNLQDFDPSLPKPCNIRILGVAPGASLVGLNVFGSSNFAFDSVFLEAINYAVNVDHVNVLNESFGDNPFPDQGSLDLTKMANDAAVAAGVTVTVSSGDSGVTNTIGSPATDPAVISAGASTTYRAYAQSGIGGINFPGVTGWLDNNISGLSSAGFDQTGGTVNIVAPGDLNWALCTPDPALYAACTNEEGQGSSVELSGGTSEAAPLTAGTAALVIQAYEQSHGGVAPTPAVVKQIIVSTAQDIAAPADQQGAGLLNAYSAVQAAASYPGTTQVSGNALLDSATELNAVAPPGTGQRFSETITNTGGTPQTVALSTRTLGAYHPIVHTTVHLSDATGDYAEVQFTVPAGQARLNGSIAYVAAGPSTDFTAGLNLSLFTPSGQLAEYNLPQGAGNYGNAQVADPAPGTWTAVIFNQAPSTEGGTVGPVLFSASSATWAPFGTLSTDSLRLPAGGSQTFTLSTRTPAQPGDVAGS
ncbi:MAG: S8 family serine peptidase, partial [Acidimicrobiales bacterium]